MALIELSTMAVTGFRPVCEAEVTPRPSEASSVNRLKYLPYLTVLTLVHTVCRCSQT